MVQREQKTYYHAVERNLTCSRRKKQMVMGKLRSSVEDYCKRHPQADLTELQSRFGTPEQIALAHVDDMESRELLKALHIRKRILGIVAGVALSVFLVVVSSIVYLMLDAKRNYDGPIERQIGKYVETVPGQYEWVVLECGILYP